MRHFSFRPSLTLSGRENYGLRGLAGKPFHPPLTDIPIAAYLFAAVFDVVSLAIPGQQHESLTRQLFVAGTWTLLGGVAVSLLAALTGWADWHRSSEPGTQARRTINAHAIIMLTVTTLAAVDLVLRLTAFADRTSSPVAMLVLSVAAGVLVSVGATYGGGLVFDYGFNVETAGDHPVWHRNEVDVFPGAHEPELELTDQQIAPA
ncbi:MAG TPA: DUF2231 domain-containing protein [Jatrophihabitantaceae bacterium]|nr:DUF2231 domain-containing protein [Jatrophihabitantaceae bacterium]